MKTKAMLLLGALLAGAPAATDAAPVNLRPAIVTNLSGELRIEQDLPSQCGDEVDQATPVSGGRLEITPAEGYAVNGGRRFDLVRATVHLAPFLIRRSCFLTEVVRDYKALTIELGVAAAPLQGVAVGPDVFAVSIPASLVLLHEAAKRNGSLEIGDLRPSEDVTGTIDLENGTVTLRAVIATKMHIREGCVANVCLVDDDFHGTLTATISGTLVFPDADGDGIPDRDDNCPQVANPDQLPVTNPVVRPPADLTVPSCSVARIGTGTVFDVCRLSTATLSSDAGVFLPGPNRVTWSGVVDGSVTTAVQTVTVVDQTPPAFTAPPADLSLTTCTPGGLVPPTARDDCGAPGVTGDSPGMFPIGRSVVSWTAADASGNLASAAQQVVVTDRQPPTATCAAVAPGVVQVTAHDDCSPATLRLGGYVLAPDERIVIAGGPAPGVRLVGTVVVGRERLRSFEVGPGEAVVTATDASANVGTCAAPVRP